MNLLTSPRLYAYTGGRPFDPAKPTVVFMHGAQHDHSVWILQSRYFAHHGYSVLAVDLPGHMRSEGPALASVEAMAERLREGLVASGATRLLLVGHSMGSLIALELARRLPDRSPAWQWSPPPSRCACPTPCSARRADDVPRALDMINVWSHSASIAAFERKPSNPGPGFSNVWQNLRLMQRIARRDGPDVLPIDFAACNGYAGRTRRGQALRCPALFVLGKSGHDDAAPRGPVADRRLRRLDRRRTRGRRPFADGGASGRGPHRTEGLCGARLRPRRRGRLQAKDAEVLDAVNWDTYWLYVLTEVALSLSPGPAVMLVIACGLAHGARRSTYASLGILSANALYFVISATALGAVLVASREFFIAVKWIGAAYLVYVGLSALFGRPSPITVSSSGARSRIPRDLYLAGLTLQLANPKTLIFFVAILPQFVDPRLAIGPQMLWLAAGSIIPEFFILAGYGWLASRATRIATDPRYARWTDRLAGVLVLGAAALVVSVTR